MDFNNNNNNNSNQNGYPGGNPYGYRYTPPVKKPGSGLATAAMILGILSILTAIMFTVYFPFIFGSLAILFALLSKNRKTKLMSQAVAGLTCGILGLVINIVIFVSSLAYIIANPNMLRETAQTYDQMYEQIYGIPSEDALGDSMENIIDDLIENKW